MDDKEVAFLSRKVHNTPSPISRGYENCDEFISNAYLLTKHHDLPHLGFNGPLYEADRESPP